MIRTGIVLPTFREAPGDALEAAHRAFEAGVDGVFCYDHIWPIGEPDRPALAPFPILAALAAATATATASASAATAAASASAATATAAASASAAAATASASRGTQTTSYGERPTTPGGGPYFGTLVARVGLVPNGVLLGQFRALDLLAPGRIIAGLGTGDRLSEAENRAYGVPFPPAAERRADMVELGRALRALDIPVWVAGGPSARVIEARAIGAALTVWDADPALVASRAQEPEAVEVTWGGPPPKGGANLERRILELAQAGATWAIFGWPIDPAALAAAARRVG